MILCSDPRARYLARRTEIDAVIRRVLESGWYILGEEVEAFEAEFATYCGVSDCIGCGNGTDAIELALRALGLGAGDEVVTVSHTAVATVAAIKCLGCTPVFVDIEPRTFTLSPDLLEAAIGPKTRAVIPVHLYGHPADMDPIMTISEKNGLHVVEDCAQAHGARYKGKRVGSIGHMGCFSFYPTKNLSAFGDGGAVVTNDSAMATNTRCLREYGWDSDRNSMVSGMNSRLDAIHAAVLRDGLTCLDEENDSRRRIASLYDEGLSGLKGVVLPRLTGDVDHVYHLYVIRVKDRDRVKAELALRGVAAGVHYPLPVHLQAAYSKFGIKLPQTESVCAEILSLPIYPELTDEYLNTVIRAVKECV